MNSDFQHVRAWVFDLDNTLYPAHCNLFAEIDTRMAVFIERHLKLRRPEARKIQKEYYVRYGTTMSGLMTEHGVKPHDFMDFVHDIDLTPLQKNNALAAIVQNLPGEKFIFTNGSTRHAENVLTKIGLDGLFSEIFDIEAAEFIPKPHQNTYEKFLQTYAIDPARAVMFEDIAQNLEAAHRLGMSTVLVTSDAEWLADEPTEKRPAAPGETYAHVHHVTDDLTAFLSQINLAKAATAAI